MLVQGTINTGETFTGTYNELGKMVLTLAGSTLQIALRVILTWFWLICLTRLRRQSLLQA